MEMTLCCMCLMGTLSGSFLIFTQLNSISRRGTQYFRGKDRPNVKNLLHFFFRHTHYAKSFYEPSKINQV